MYAKSVSRCKVVRTCSLFISQSLVAKETNHFAIGIYPKTSSSANDSVTVVKVSVQEQVQSVLPAALVNGHLRQ